MQTAERSVPLFDYRGERNECGFEDPTLPLAVVVARTQWDEAPRIRHQLARQLMRWFNVLFVEFFPDEHGAPASNQVRPAHERLLLFRSQTWFQIPSRAYANLPPLHSLGNRACSRQIAEMARRQQASPVILVNFVHDFPEIMSVPLFSYKIYVCFDEWPQMWRRSTRPWGPKFYYHSKLYQHYENQVAKRADRCLASHTPLQEKLSRVNPRTSLFLHGHEFKHTFPAEPRRRSPGTIKVGFMGYITYNLMLDWLTAVLDAEGMDLVLIGPPHEFDLTPFLKRMNFTHVPPLSGQSLLQKLTEMDVLIMPYDPCIPEVRVQTVSNKFFQYLAAGRPVVISNMPCYIPMPRGVLYRANSALEFVDKIRQARGEDCPEFTELRLRIAQENTWDKRGDMLYSIIQGDTGGKFATASREQSSLRPFAASTKVPALP